MRRVFLLMVIASGALLPITGLAASHAGWAWVDGNGGGMAGNYDWDRRYPQDDDGVMIYPTLKACMRDKAVHLKEVETATPLIDRDDRTGYSAGAHKDLQKDQNATCQPYIKGKFAPAAAEERSGDWKTQYH